MEKHYVINVTPIPWKRPGVNKKRFYDTQSQEKLVFGISLSQQHEGLALYSKAICLTITFFMPIPREKKGKPLTSNHSRKPDLDNLLKFVLDAANNVLWVDDKVISGLHASKVYDKRPRIEFTVTTLE